MRIAFFRVLVYGDKTEGASNKENVPKLCLRMTSSACVALTISVQARPPPTSLCTPFHPFQRITLRTRYRDIEDTVFEYRSGCGWHWRSMWFPSLSGKFQIITFKRTAAYAFQILNIQNTWASYFIRRSVYCCSCLMCVLLSYVYLLYYVCIVSFYFRCRTAG